MSVVRVQKKVFHNLSLHFSLKLLAHHNMQLQDSEYTEARMSGSLYSHGRDEVQQYPVPLVNTGSRNGPS